MMAKSRLSNIALASAMSTFAATFGTLVLQTETVHASQCYIEGYAIGEGCYSDPGENEGCGGCVVYLCWLFAGGGSPPYDGECHETCMTAGGAQCEG